jgi:hypothetical protein
MTLAESAVHPENEIEGLLTALTGVLAARVALSDFGRIEEIHVLSDAQTHPKQIVRNIESALSAGLGVSVDRRLISVAQVRSDDAFTPERPEAAHGPATHPGAPTARVEPADAAQDAAQDATQDAAQDATQDPTHDAAGGRAPAKPSPPAADEAGTGIAGAATAGAHGRFVFVGYDARTQPDLEAACRVTIRRYNDVFSGTGTGPSTALGRAQAAASAVFSAVAHARRNQALGLEGVNVVESHGRSYVLVAAHAITGRSSVPLTGIAALHRSPEEAAILASLQAMNRWNELDE